ncbi:MAG: hypothetical protein JW951_08290 [Lentisphaerae bacterium]|nr:hypothetical protein [Lentisphaerota bacterium]
MRIRRFVISRLSAFALLVILPLAGVRLAGRPLGPYLEFPPGTRHVQHAPFAWPVFILLATALAAVLLPFLRRVIRAPQPASAPRPEAGRFPLWGVAGILLGAAAWFLSWTRFDGCEPFRRYLFFPLWLGYIITVNALCRRRSGTSPLTRRPGLYLALFAVSALFWWFFEYLNRFAQNWHYLGHQVNAPSTYFWTATLHFSIVLPAVHATAALLRTLPRLHRGLENFAPLRLARPRAAAWAGLALFGPALALIGVRPNLLFPLLWIAPLAVMTAVQTLAGEPTVFAGVKRGDWRRVWIFALAALVCGFFWELWNAYSHVKWVYTVPYVGRFRIFEMPVLGFAGYLPFGLECAAVVDFLGLRRIN